MMDQQVPQNYGNSLHRLDQSGREQYINLEKYQRRVIQGKFSGMFNRICIITVYVSFAVFAMW